MTYCATVIGHLTGFEGYDSDSVLRMIGGCRVSQLTICQRLPADLCQDLGGGIRF